MQCAIIYTEACFICFLRMISINSLAPSSGVCVSIALVSFQTPDEYCLIWISTDLISFAVVLGIFIFQK